MKRSAQPRWPQLPGPAQPTAHSEPGQASGPTSVALPTCPRRRRTGQLWFSQAPLGVRGGPSRSPKTTPPPLGVSLDSV